MITRSILVVSLLHTMGSGASAQAQRTAPAAGIRDAAARLFTAYGLAIATPRLGEIAQFYDTGPVLRVINGTTRRTTRAALDSVYRFRWQAPTFFQFDSLAYDSISPRQVLVTGRFRWQSAGSMDTVPFLYAALVEAVGGEMVIRFEHETEIPRPR